MKWCALVLLVLAAAGCDAAIPEPDAAIPEPDAAVDAAIATDAGSDDAACPSPPPDGALEAELGSGFDGLVELPDGSPIEVFAGTQGGFHVFVTVVSSGVDGAELAGRVELELQAYGAMGEVLADVVFRSNVTRGSLELAGLLLVLDVPSLEAVRGEPLQVSATVRSPCGLTTTVEHDWIMTAP